MSEGANPYESPKTTAAFDEEGDYKPKVFSTQGRIGRLRYFAYSTLYYVFLVMVFVVFASGVLPMLKSVGVVFNAIVYILIVVIALISVIYFFFTNARRRVYDLNHSAWFLMLLFVPGINILFLFYLLIWPGSSIENNYGLPPQGNTLLEFITGALACVMVVGYSFW